MQDPVDYLIIGGGIIGVSTAYKLSLKFPEKKIFILEKEDEICMHQSGRNSGVIHSGIYYPPQSLKAKNCINGYHQLIKFCDEYQIEYKLCGKLIVAHTDSEIEQMNKLHQRGIDNKLDGIIKMNWEEAKQIEPNVICKEALWIPQTGITDYKVIAKKLLSLSLAINTTIHYLQEVIEFNSENSEFIEVKSKKQSFLAKKVINCAGIYSDKIGLISKDKITHKIIPFKGEFYKIKSEKKDIVNGLIYPVPNPEFPFLGVHMTKLISSEVKAGPNAILAFKREGYKKFEFSFADFWESMTYFGFLKLALKYRAEGWEEMKRSFSKRLFYNSICKIVKGLTMDDIEPFYPGIRAQALYNTGKLEDDFLISENGNFLHVYNSPSPAATGCLAIADTIIEQLN
jgi:(S)-2-hydroxyglutarate dehydrogenase